VLSERAPEWAVRRLVFSPDGKRLAVVRADHHVAIWDAASTSLQWSLEEDDKVPASLFDDVVMDVELGSKGSLVVTTIEGRYLRRRDGSWISQARPLDSGHGEPTMECAEQGRRCVAPVPGGMGIAEIGKGTRVLATGEPDRFAFGPEGRRLVVARGYDLALWDVEKGRRINPPPKAAPSGPLSMSGDGLLLTVHDHELKLWRLPDDGPQRTARLTAANAALSRDGKLVVAATENGVKALSTTTGKIRSLAKGRFTNRLAIAANGTRVAAVQRGEEELTLRIIDTRSGAAIWSRTIADDLWMLALSPDGDRVAWTVETQLELWTTRGKRLAKVDLEHAADDLAFSPKGDDLIVAGDGHIERYSALDGVHRGFVGEHASVESFDVSEDGRLLVSGGLDHMVRVFDLRQGRLLAVLPGHGRWVHSVAVSSDPPVATSLDQDGMILRWDLRPWVGGH
jgi:WD40 repeat protein